MTRAGTVSAIAITIAAQILLALVVVAAWRMLDDDVRTAGKVLAAVAGGVSAFAGLAFLVPLAKAGMRRRA